MTNDKAADLFKALAKSQGFTDEQVAKAMAAPEWKEIENRDNRHSEYSSALDKARNLEEKLKTADPYRAWWQEKGGADWYEKSKADAQTLARYQERFGDLDPNNPNDVQRGANASGLSMAQVQEMLKARDNDIGVRVSQMTNELLAVTVDAQERGVKLTGNDVLAMQKIMADKGVTYAAAYQLHLGPRVHEMEQQRLEKEKKDYAAEQVRDALSRIGHNGIPSASEVPNFFDRPKTGVAEKSLSDQELLGMWNDAAPGKNRAA